MTMILTLTIGLLLHMTTQTLAVVSVDKEMDTLKNTISTVTRQLMLQQFFNEQRVRSEGQSGVKCVRQRRGGTKNYFVESHTGSSAASIHDHSNNIRTVGMGELNAVLNGIEFRTRHNDYRLYMPHKTKKDYHATEPIPFPEVPPNVTEKATVQEQIEEMKKWFKAWKDQNTTERDYRKYFRPVLCYLEGAWTNSGSKIDEPFTSDRHFIDANSWMELHEKVRYVAYSGTKSRNENLSFLPTKIMKLINNTFPEFAQWNYRILCHPLKKDLPLNRLRVVDDLSSRMRNRKSLNNHKISRTARFQLNMKDSKVFFDRATGRGLLDEMMEEIPGKDNYKGNITDNGLESPTLNTDKTVKDASRYHRWFTIPGRDAMGVANIHRGFNDEFMFAAMNTQSKVASIDLEKCGNYDKKLKKRLCTTQSQKWSYAIPLEIIYLTPLSKWNPYNLQYHGEHRTQKQKAQASGRNGECAQDKAFTGTTSKLYYNTPTEFFSGEKVGKDSADTDKKSVCVLDGNGVMRKVRASGIHIFLPKIEGLGSLRQRYPIFPVHGEGSSVWKELNALKEIVMMPKRYNWMKWEQNTLKNKRKIVKDLVIESGVSRSDQPTETTSHTHKVILTKAEVRQLKRGRKVTKKSDLESSHQHTFVISWDKTRSKYEYVKCDGEVLCFDKHEKDFTVSTK